MSKRKLQSDEKDQEQKKAVKSDTLTKQFLDWLWLKDPWYKSYFFNALRYALKSISMPCLPRDIVSQLEHKDKFLLLLSDGKISLPADELLEWSMCLIPGNLIHQSDDYYRVQFYSTIDKYSSGSRYYQPQSDQQRVVNYLVCKDIDEKAWWASCSGLGKDQTQLCVAGREIINNIRQITSQSKSKQKQKFSVQIHQVACMLSIEGHMADRVTLDCSHLCSVKGCFNPHHLLYETHQANMDRQRCSGLILTMFQDYKLDSSSIARNFVIDSTYCPHSRLVSSKLAACCRRLTLVKLDQKKVLMTPELKASFSSFIQTQKM